MTSPPISPGVQGSGTPRSEAPRPDSQRDNPERQARRRQAVSKARARMRTANGRDGNGLKDAAKRVSDAVRERMGNRGDTAASDARPTPRPRPTEGEGRKPDPQAAEKAVQMAREKAAQIKSAAQSLQQSSPARGVPVRR